MATEDFKTRSAKCIHGRFVQGRIEAKFKRSDFHNIDLIY